MWKTLKAGGVGIPILGVLWMLAAGRFHFNKFNIFCKTSFKISFLKKEQTLLK
jgi:hypothetical protein